MQIAKLIVVDGGAFGFKEYPWFLAFHLEIGFSAGKWKRESREIIFLNSFQKQVVSNKDRKEITFVQANSTS